MQSPGRFQRMSDRSPARVRPGGRRGWRRAVLSAAWYPPLLVAGSLLVAAQPQDRRVCWLRWISTNLNSLTDTRNPLHPVASLLLSGVVSEENVLAWAVLAVIGLTTLGARLGVGPTVGLVIGVHVLASVASQTIIFWRIEAGAESDAARHVTDVGASYLVVAALLAATLYGGPLVGRVLSAVGFLALTPSLFDGLQRWEVSALGHLVSILLTVTAGWVLTRGHPRTRTASP